MIYVFIQNKSFNRQIKYVFDTFFNILGLEYKYIELPIYNFKINESDMLLSYVDNEYGYESAIDESNNVIIIKNSMKFFNHQFMEKFSSPMVRRYILKKPINNNCDIISIYNCNSELYIDEAFDEKKIISTNLDIISDSFFMLSRYEEIMESNAYITEKYNRFPVNASTAYKNNFLLRPVVNEYIELLWSWIDGMNLDYKRKNWWGKSDFAACLTHDVDSVQRYTNFYSEIIPTLSLLLKHKSFKKAIDNTKNMIKSKKDYKKDIHWTFEYIKDIEKKYNFKSSFFFLAGGTTEYEGFYKISDERIVKLIKELEEDGFEVGCHGSFNSYKNFHIMLEEKKSADFVFSNSQYGCRQHYLRFEMPYTLENHERVGFIYDTTMGFAEHEGFRCGICFPYRPYDLIENRVLNIWEIPPVVMDFSFQESGYRGLSQEESLKQMKFMIDIVKKHRGVFTLLWHNANFENIRGSWKNVYEETMSYLYVNNCSGMSGKEIINIVDSSF